jgi:mannosyl-oligosaccharide glucosidase
MARTTFAAILASFGLLATLCGAAQEDPAILINEIGRASNESLLWGPYKPNLYFGVRPKIPKSLAAGFLWVKVDNFQDVQNSMCNAHEVLRTFGLEDEL